MRTDIVSGSARSAGRWLHTHRLAIVRASLILLVLLASSLLAPRVAIGNRYPTFLMAAVSGVALLGLLLRWPSVGLVLGLLGGIFVPQSWQGGFNLSQIAVAGMLGIWLLDMLVSRKRIELVRSRTLVPILAFAVASVFSFCLGQFSWYPFARNAPLEAQLGGLAIHLLSAGAFLVVAHLVRDLQKLALLTWTFIGLGAVYVLGRFLHLGWIDRIYHNGFTAGSLFWVWLAALLCGQIIANRHLNVAARALLVVALGLTFYVGIVQAYDWRSGWFPPLVSVAAIFTIRYWRIARYLAVLGVIPFYLIVTASIGQEDWSWVTRLEAWIIVLSIAQVSPLFGMGFANYYWYTPLFPIRGYAVRFNSHSQIVDLVAQTGLVGLACFAWFVTEVGLLGLRLIISAPEGFAKGYVFGALGGLAGTIVAAYLVDWVLPFVYNIGMTGFRASVLAWLFMGGLVSIEQVVRRQGQSLLAPVNVSANSVSG